jgi:SAM-dependent methyltransferase
MDSAGILPYRPFSTPRRTETGRAWACGLSESDPGGRLGVLALLPVDILHRQGRYSVERRIEVKRAMNEKDLTPGKLMWIAGAYWQAFALHAAVKLDIFTLIGTDRLTGEEIAEKLGGDIRGVTTLLNALMALELLEKTGDHFASTPLCSKFLSRESPAYLGHIITHHYHLVDSWHHLDESVLTGKPNRHRSSIRGKEEREAFLMGMFNAAMMQAPQTVKAIDLSGRKLLLDLGGGPGTWAIHFCLQNPGLRAILFDLPETRPFAQKTIERFGLSNRIRFQGGDYLKDDFGAGYDVAWLSQVLHAEGPEACRALIRKVMSSLLPGGLLLIHEFILNNDMAGPLMPALFSLNMLCGTEAGRSYSEQQITEMMREAGARDVRRLPLHSPLESGIIAGTK